MRGVREAAHAEYDPDAPLPLITLAVCPVPDRPEGAALLAGEHTLRLDPRSRAFRLYRQAEVRESFICSYELNPSFRHLVESGDLIVSGTGENGEVRLVELLGHPFFLATLFVPQLKSREDSPHPLVTDFMQAARRRKGDVAWR